MRISLIKCRHANMKRSNEDTRSRQIFFTARIKNKREDTKLKYEVKQIEREFGHTIFSIHKDIRDLKAELKITKRSSGHSSEGWFPGSDDHTLSMPNDRLRSTTSAGRRKNALEHIRHQKRVSSAPVSGNFRDKKADKGPTEIPEIHDQEIDQLASNSKSGDKQTTKGKVMVTQKHGMRTSATKIVPAEWEPRPKIQNEGFEDDVNVAKEMEPTGNDQRALNNQMVKKNSYLTPIVTLKSDGQDQIKLDSKNDELLKPGCDDAFERPLSPAMTKAVRDRWLKPSLKTKTNDKDNHDNVVEKPKKTVRISSHTSHYQENNTSDVNLPTSERTVKTLPPKKFMKTAFMTQSSSPSADPHPTTNLWTSLSSKVTGNPNEELAKKSVNVIPDVRKKVMSVEEKKMKRKRDNLLASSVSALLAGKTLRRNNADGISESGKGEDEEGKRIIPGAGNEPSPSPNPRRRFSFGSIAMLAVNQHRAFPVEKKATLGSRLRLKTPAENSHERNIDIRKSVLVDDSDSDDDHKSNYTAPAKPAIDLKNVKSKVSNQWNQDAALEKPPTLADDTFQLQRSLAAAHISRGRDLRDMQDENVVDPMKVIDQDRQSALMMKFKAFNQLLSGGNTKKENRRKSVMDAIHAGTDGKQILKLMRLANQN